jgi:O-antigen ligase
VVRSLVVVAVVCVVGVAAGVPHDAHDRWQEFKAPVGAVAAGAQDNVFSRLSAANGNGRYQYWQAARDADGTSPLKGIGPGTFEFWWARDGTTPGFIRDAHSLYFETLAETGIVGLVLLGGLLASLLMVALVRSLRAPPALRIWLAAAVAAVATFMTAAASEWVWEMAAIGTGFPGRLAHACDDDRGVGQRQQEESVGDGQQR